MKTTNVTSYIDIFEQLYYIFTTYIIHIVHSKYSFCLQLISPYIFYLDENNYPFFPPQPVPEGNEKFVFRPEIGKIFFLCLSGGKRFLSFLILLSRGKHRGGDITHFSNSGYTAKPSWANFHNWHGNLLFIIALCVF